MVPARDSLGPSANDVAGAGATDRSSSGGPFSSGLQTWVSRPHPDVLVLTLTGSVDALTIEHFRDVLWPRLSAAIRVLVVELTEVEFLGVAGLQLLKQAHLGADMRGITLGLVGCRGEAWRAVHMAGLDRKLECYPTVDHVLHGLRGE